MFTHLLEASCTFIENIIIQGKEKGLLSQTNKAEKEGDGVESVNDFNDFKAR